MSTRRAALRILAGTLLGAPWALLDGQGAAAVCVGLGRGCGRHKRCCAGTVCTRGTCRCREERKACGGRCVDLDRDPNHCGTCRKVCLAGTTCRRGRCVNRTCPAGEDWCAGDVGSGCNGRGDCTCRRTLAGATRCGATIRDGGGCDECTTDAQCATTYGPGAFCGDSSGPGCSCPSTLAGLCMAPC